LLLLLQVNCLQSELKLQLFLSLLHWPPWIGQSALEVQTWPVTLQLPAAGQSDCDMQAFPVKLQAPG
jgi:hypothetical protein